MLDSGEFATRFERFLGTSKGPYEEWDEESARGQLERAIDLAIEAMLDAQPAEPLSFLAASVLQMAAEKPWAEPEA